MPTVKQDGSWVNTETGENMGGDPFGWPPTPVHVTPERRWYGWRGLIWTYREKYWAKALTRRGLLRKARRYFGGHTYAAPQFTREVPRWAR